MVYMFTRLFWPDPSSAKTSIRGREQYMPALLSSSSLAVHASLIHTVGLRPIQYVIKGVLYVFESSSKYIQGLLSGSWNVLPTMGYGNGPGG
jgi:predicted membrane protein